MEKILLILAFIFGLTSGSSAQSGYKIKLNVDGYLNDTLIVGYYFGKSQRVLDTLYSKKPGRFILEAKDTTLHHGVYLGLVRPNNNYFQFVVDEDQKFTLNTTILDLFDAKIKGSKGNEVFFDYLNFLKTQNDKVSKIQSDYSDKHSEADSLKKISLLQNLNTEVTAKQNKILLDSPNSIMSIIINNDLGVEIPDFEGSMNDIQVAKYKYFRKHYFDHVNLSNDINLYTPAFNSKVIDYIDKWTPNHPDSMIVAIDDLLLKMKDAPESYKYYLSTFINKYGRSRIVGQDAVYVHLAQNYYGAGKAPWADRSTIKKITKEARMMEGALIGKKAANVKLFKEDSTSIMLHDIKSKYTVLLFWSPTCGHCKKSMPDVIKFQEEFRNKGVKVVAICTKHQKDYDSCWDGVKKEHMENFLNLGDRNHRSRFKLKFNVRTTPKIFILNEDKDILIKDIPTNKLDEVLNALIKGEEEIKTKVK